ncbi:MAG: hypothetical protein JWP89_456 [Schlesneria sp.]|nr:hypothetical protein [Schlesneria sp.]
MIRKDSLALKRRNAGDILMQKLNTTLRRIDSPL